MDRRAFLAAGSAVAAAGALGATTPASKMDGSSEAPGLFTRVNFNSDGLALDPREYSILLGDVVRELDARPDYYSLGGAIEHVEREFAARLGKAVAMYVPTGTLANHLAIRGVARPGERVLVQADSHLFNDSGDCADVLSGINLIPLGAGRATIRLEEIHAWVERSANGRVAGRVAAIVIEDPVRRHGHEHFDPAELAKISQYARANGIHLHLDGARMFNLPLHTGRSVMEHAALFDTVYVSLWKHFNAASGAVLAGPSESIVGLYHDRRRFGGSLPAAWPSAVPALHFLRTYEADYAQAWQSAERLFSRLAASSRVRISRPPRSTSRVQMDFDGVDPNRFQTRLAEAGIQLSTPQNGQKTYTILVNTSLLRRPPDALADAFLYALNDSGI